MNKNSSKWSTATVLLALSTGACGIFGSDATEVRLTNDSDLSFDQVSFYAGDGLEEYSDLAAGASTPFVTVSMAYGITTTQVVIGTDTVRLQVIDFVGEAPLDGGRYSYVLDVNGAPGARNLEQRLQREDR